MIVRLRAAAYAAWFYGVTLAYSLAGLWVRLFARHLALGLARRWARMALAGLWPICRIRMVVTGWHHLPSRGPALLAGQHQSEFDTLVWMMLLERPSYVMKQELRRIPLFGPLLVPAGMIPVDRSAGAPAMRGLMRATVDAVERDRQIVIFPEGTRTPPGRHVKLQPGIAAIAARTGLAVLPVATDSGLCWPRALLGKRAGIIHVAIGPPIDTPSRREEMLSRIEAFWRQMEATGFEAVDNSVETASVLQPPRSADAG